MSTVQNDSGHKSGLACARRPYDDNRLVVTRNRQTSSSSWNGVRKCEDCCANGTSDIHHNVCSEGKIKRSHCEPIYIKSERWVDKKRAMPQP